MDELQKALDYEGRKTLPKIWTGKGSWIWTRAIVRVAKADGTRSWAIMTYDGSEYSTIKDFGTPSMVRAIEEIRPTKWLRPDQLPILATREQCISFLCVGGYKAEETIALLEAKDNEELRRRVFRTAVEIAEKEASFLAKWRNRDKRKKRGRKSKDEMRFLKASHPNLLH